MSPQPQPPQPQPGTTPGITVVAPHGTRMIELAVCFYSNGVAGTPEGPTKGEIIPKVVYAGGTVRVKRNLSHGIEAQENVPFNSEAEIPLAIERALIAAGIRMVRNPNTTIPAWTNADGPAFMVDYFAVKEGYSTKLGYLNRNNCRVVGPALGAGTDHNAKLYPLRHEADLGGCGGIFGSNGTDNHDRKCPFDQGGAPGLVLPADFKPMC